MKRTSFKSSSLKFTTAIAITALMGGAAFAGPDTPKEDAKDTKTNVERIVVEETTTVDASIMPNDALETEVSSAEAKDIDATWSEETSEEVVIELPTTEEEALLNEAGDVVVENPEAVIISNPDDVIESETDEESTPED